MTSKIGIVTTLMFLFGFNVFSQVGTDYSKITFNSQDDKYLNITTSFYSTNKKDAEERAVKDFFKSLISAGGIVGYNEEKPLLINFDQLRLQYNSYFNAFFGGRYNIFVKERTTISKNKRSNGDYYNTIIQLKVSVFALNREFENKGFINEQFGKGKENENIVQPTIMVVPYVTGNQSYADAIQSDFDIRTAISKVKEGFDKRGINTIDFEAKLNAAQRSNLFEQKSNKNLDEQLIRNSGADIYVTVDLKKDFSASGNQVSLLLSAYETSSGQSLANKKSWSGQFRTNQIDRLCEIAVELIIEEFLNTLNQKFKKDIKLGDTVVLNVSIFNGSTFSMDTEVGVMEFPLTDALRLWVKKNSMNGYYHLQGSTEFSAIYDDIKIPFKDEFGNSQDVNDFAFKIWEFFQSELEIKCSKKVDKQTIYIQIK